MTSSALTFHTLATNKFNTVYYSAVANPRPEDSAIVLNYEKQNAADPKIQKNIIQPFFIQSGDGKAPSNENGMNLDGIISSNNDYPITEHLSRIQSVFVTCAIPPFHSESNGPCVEIVSGIGHQCRKSFPNMKIERSFFKVQLGNNFYNATSELERDKNTPPHLRLFLLPKS